MDGAMTLLDPILLHHIALSSACLTSDRTAGRNIAAAGRTNILYGISSRPGNRRT